MKQTCFKFEIRFEMEFKEIWNWFETEWNMDETWMKHEWNMNEIT